MMNLMERKERKIRIYDVYFVKITSTWVIEG
jgi:hypothetical protein